jgi:hypothetical protein
VNLIELDKVPFSLLIEIEGLPPQPGIGLGLFAAGPPGISTGVGYCLCGALSPRGKPLRSLSGPVLPPMLARLTNFKPPVTFTKGRSPALSAFGDCVPLVSY